MALVSSFRILWAGPTAQKRVWSNIGWLFADRVVRQGLGLVVLIWMARYLGPAQFGLLNYAVAYVALVWSFTDLGLSSIVVRNLVNTPNEAPGILGAAFFLRLAAVIAAWSIAVAGISWLRPEDDVTLTLVIIIASGMIFQFLDTLGWWFEALVKSKYVVWARTTAFLVSALLRVTLILAHAPLLAFGLLNAVEIALAGIAIGIVFYTQQTNGFRLRFTWSYARVLLRDSWPLIFSNLAIVIYMRVDQVMLGTMRGDIEVGIYSVVVLIAESAYFVPMIVMPSLLPDIVAAKKESESLFYARLDHLYRLMAFLAYVVAIPLAFISLPLVPALFGPAYTSGGPVLAVLAVAGVFTFMGVARTAFLVTMNWNRTHLATVGTSCALNIVLNLALIPRFGAFGAAIASAIAYWFAAYGMCFLYRPLNHTGVMLTRAMLYPKFWN